MELERLVVRGLFGRFNYSIGFNKENITIITAPNGYGKTICLKILDSIFNRRLSFLQSLSFLMVEVKTSQGSLFIQKNDPESSEISLYLEGHEKEYHISKGVNLNERKISLSRIDAYIPFLNRIGPREWEDSRSGELYSLDEVVDSFSDYLPDNYMKRSFPDWYVNFSDSLNAHFVQDQRLIQRTVNVHSRVRKSSFIDTIEKYSSELSDLIRESGFKAAQVSQNLDSTFPVRLLSNIGPIKTLSEEKIVNELNDLQERRAELSGFNLLTTEPDFPELQAGEIKDEDRKVLTLYISDTEKKLSAYESLYRKIELFTRILNTKRLSFKKIKVSSLKGFFFETYSGDGLKSTQLSSGEQHQVVLLYELIFKTEKDVLVLIDEPEISLHVAWQKEFLKDLKEIIALQNMPVVIATHSPQIIDGSWDLTVDLEYGGYDESVY